MKSCLPFSCFLLILTGVMALACGSPAPVPLTNSGIPTSVSLSPATADAQDYPDGLVQFVATGYYSTAPYKVMPLKASAWGVCQQNTPSTAVSITDKGLAQCQAGASGVFSVFASVGTMCNVIGPCGTGCQVSGYAQLACP